MWYLYLLSWIALAIQICVITLAIAAGLYYLAELVEEYTVYTSKVIRCLLIFTTLVYIGLFLFEDIPLSMIIVGLLGNVTYFGVLRDFPYFYISSPAFVGSVVLLLLNHYFTFSYFSEVWHPFSEVMAYFTLCLWIVPFTFFVSLSANENVLPTVTDRAPPGMDEDQDIVSNYFKRKGKKYGLLSFFKYAQESVLPQRVKKHF
ncbi:hypothetical protein CHS0354_006136 [Potamilus streckersoni]|uniref:Protein TEX261 n=2 Tax=Potamilus streckersoni TaxID=2493646 RepID=A0AAE0W0R1_9BIVA|nr:hypothetical protein CHS0354_006136 [Potamilus streckersoni]